MVIVKCFTIKLSEFNIFKVLDQKKCKYGTCITISHYSFYRNKKIKITAKIEVGTKKIRLVQYSFDNHFCSFIQIPWRKHMKLLCTTNERRHFLYSEPKQIAKFHSIVNNSIAIGDTISDYFPNFPWHAQTVEQVIKLVTEASALVSGKRDRVGLSRTRINSGNKNLKFERKRTIMCHGN